MRLIRLHVDNFGTLRNFDLSFDEGMNVLYQKNGWGKSTLAVFIKAMLYGLPASSKRSLDENERKKYMPWQGGSYGGSLEIETGRGKFRIERTFAAKESGDTFALFDLATNKPSDVYSDALGEELFGIDVDGFERSTYLSQRTLTGGKDNNSISAKLGDLLDDVGDVGCFDAAMEALDRRRRYYVMTGNRGAIAELEGEMLAKETELERCRRVEEAMCAQLEELEALDAELVATRKTAEENRIRLERAGLARERAALLEQKNRMLAELVALSEKKKRIIDTLGGEPPNAEALEENKLLWERICSAKAKVDAQVISEADAENLARLRARFSARVPREEILDRADQNHERLRELRIHREALLERKNADRFSERFAAGVPSQPELDQAFEQLSNAEQLGKSLDIFVPQAGAAPRSSAFLGALLAVLGVGLAALGFIPSVAGLSFLFLGVGMTFIVIGGLIALLIGRRHAQALHGQNELRQRRQAWEKQRERDLSAVRELLSSYGISTEDLSRGLTDLTVSAERYRELAHQRTRENEELETIVSQIDEGKSLLHAYLRKFYNDLPLKEDYRAELEQLRREVAELLHAERGEQARQAAHQSAEAVLRELKLSLQPFLRKYDPEGSMRARECLEWVSEQTSEYRRTVREIGEREETLKRFVAEKKLGEDIPDDDVTLFDRLADEQRALQSRNEALEEQRARKKSSIERLALDADRIPELEEMLAQIRLRLDEARANAATIKATASFLEEAKTALSTRYLDGMQKSFDQLLTMLVGDGAPEAIMDTSFEVSLRPDGGQTRTMESFSRGWRDAVELCVRFSLTEALYEDGESPFLLLDDPLVNLDDERLVAARALLEELSQKYQILYFVCHKDRI